MNVMGTLDLSIQGWFIDPSEVEICKREDGTDWLLGAGEMPFHPVMAGRVRCVLLLLL